MATHSSIPAWEIPWTQEPGGLSSVGHKTVRHDLATKHNLIHGLSCVHIHKMCGTKVGVSLDTDIQLYTQVQTGENTAL